jgi:transcriptional antiterminator RfaH
LARAHARPWYVCVTKARQEAFAASKLVEQGYELYLPMLESWVRRGGAWRRQQTVMFPRYAFVRPAAPEQAVSPIRSTPGVTGLVSFGPKLACMSEDRLDALRKLVAARAACLPEQPLAPGTRVVLAAGPLAGMTGIVSSVAAERVSVMMSLLGREQAVAVRGEQLALA